MRVAMEYSVNLPVPSPAAEEHSHRVREAVARAIDAAGGWLPFSGYMNLALYEPGLGYYAAGARKFGAEGDFITAPELTPLFGRAVAVQLVELMEWSAPRIVEVGGGTGALAADLLNELTRRNAPPLSYEILELSADLRARQQETLRRRAPELMDRVSWLDRLPDRYSGVVVANEVLDVMPVQLVTWKAGGIFERGVVVGGGGDFAWEDRPASGALLRAAQALGVTAPYLSEICLAARAWIAEWGRRLADGAIVVIDYGFPRHEYYHPQRSAGTLRCHYRHRAHNDPFYLPGLNDITAHVDFTAIAQAGNEAGLELLGYGSQAQFLLNCGILDILQEAAPVTGSTYLRQAADVQRLLSPAEMGELFKAMVLGRGIEHPLVGFLRGDRRHSL